MAYGPSLAVMRMLALIEWNLAFLPFVELPLPLAAFLLLVRLPDPKPLDGVMNLPAIDVHFSKMSDGVRFSILQVILVKIDDNLTMHFMLDVLHGNAR